MAAPDKQVQHRTARFEVVAHAGQDSSDNHHTLLGCSAGVAFGLFFQGAGAAVGVLLQGFIQLCSLILKAAVAQLCAAFSSGPAGNGAVAGARPWQRQRVLCAQ
jgi:hypothetical protein